MAMLETLNVGAYENNWDKIEIIAIDGRRVSPKREVALQPGKTTITFGLSYMRGDLETPIFAEVPVEADLLAGRTYRAYPQYQTSMLGVWIEDKNHTERRDAVVGGASVYNQKFEEYGQKRK